MDDKLTEKELDKALQGTCPKCPIGYVVEIKIKGEDNVWQLQCERCSFSYQHRFAPIEKKT